MNEKIIGAAIHIGAIAVVGAIEIIGTKMIMKKIEKNIKNIQKSSDNDEQSAEFSAT